MTFYRQSVDRLCGRDGTRVDAERVADLMNGFLSDSQILITVSNTDDRISDEHRLIVQEAWVQALALLGD